MQEFPLKSLCTLELSKLNQFLSGEGLSPTLLDNHMLRCYYSVEKPVQLQQYSRAALEDRSQWIRSIVHVDPWEESHSEGTARFVLVWDHWQEALVEICCRSVGTSQERRKAMRVEDVWDESESNEAFSQGNTSGREFPETCVLYV